MCSPRRPRSNRCCTRHGFCVVTERAAAAVKHTRAQPPDPQARGPLSLWTGLARDKYPVSTMIRSTHNRTTNFQFYKSYNSEKSEMSYLPAIAQFLKHVNTIHDSFRPNGLCARLPSQPESHLHRHRTTLNTSASPSQHPAARQPHLATQSQKKSSQFRHSGCRSSGDTPTRPARCGVAA